MFLKGRFQMIMRSRFFSAFVALIFFVPAVAGAQIGASGTQLQHQTAREYDGPPVTLQALLDDALANNPDLAALRQQSAVVRQRPNQERGLNPPMAEAMIWQWPINTLNP